MGLPDYVIFMRKYGNNEELIEHTNDNFPVDLWQDYASPVWREYASPVWWDIQQSNTLNRMFSDEESERHICPLQLDVIERCLKLYSNENDVIFTPFMGVGSEVYQSVKMNRKAIGIELKKEYYEQAVKNLKTLDDADKQISLEDYFNLKV